MEVEGRRQHVDWPVAVVGKGNQGVASCMQRIQGSIGHVEYAYIIENHMKYVRTINSAARS